MWARFRRPRAAVRGCFYGGRVAPFCKSGTPVGSSQKTAKCISAGIRRGEGVACAAAHSPDTVKDWSSNRSRKTYQLTPTAFHRMARHVLGHEGNSPGETQQDFKPVFSSGDWRFLTLVTDRARISQAPQSRAPRWATRSATPGAPGEHQVSTRIL